MRVETIAVLGANKQGRLLAASALAAGYRVVLDDFRADISQETVSAIRRSVEDSRRQNSLALPAEEILTRLSAFRSVGDACRAGADLILDFTVDELELKLEIFTLLDKFALPGAICATNATCATIAELGAMTYRPELCVGLRFSEDSGEKTIEIVRSPQTSDLAVEGCSEFARRIGWSSSVRVEDAGGAAAPHAPAASAPAIESASSPSAMIRPAMDLAERIIMLQGDVTEMDCDAVVNAANNDLQLGGGVAGAIRRKGGDSIQCECDAIGSIPVGGAAITGGGGLKARHVIHAASMALGGQTTAIALRSSTAHSLRIANERGLHSIAFPAVGTGIAGFPLSECAAIMLHEVARHLRGATSLEKIYFVLFDDRGLRAFQNEFAAMKARGELGESGAAAQL